MAHRGHGNHWQCVVEDLQQLMRLLPIMIERGHFIDAVGNGGFTEGATAGIAWPDTPLRALSLISGVRKDEDRVSQQLVSAFPCAANGLKQRLVVKEIIPWENGVEAWIKASMPSGDGPALTFFDTRFYANRRLMKVGLEAEFVLAGLAYFAEVIHPEPVVITEQDVIRAMRADTTRADDLSPIEVHMEGAAILFLRDDYAPDEYEFQGPVKAVETFDVFDRRMTKLTLTVARLLDANDTDVDIELFVGDHVWRTNERPAPGADVRGLLWLQGFLST